MIHLSTWGRGPQKPQNRPLSLDNDSFIVGYNLVAFTEIVPTNKQKPGLKNTAASLSPGKLIAIPLYTNELVKVYEDAINKKNRRLFFKPSSQMVI